MRNPRLQRHHLRNWLLVILLVWLLWLLYASLKPPPLETLLTGRMRCAYNYRDAKLTRRAYANGIVYYQCASQ